MKLIGNWKRCDDRLRGLSVRAKQAFLEANTRVAEQLVVRVKEGLRSQSPGGRQFESLHPFTVMQKGSSTALAGGALEDSVRASVTNGGFTIHVGVSAQARHPSGAPMAMIARVQEYGIAIEVTPAMRGYLASQGLFLQLSTTHIEIPPRPFLGPVLKSAGLVVREGARKALQYTLGAKR